MASPEAAASRSKYPSIDVLDAEGAASWPNVQRKRSVRGDERKTRPALCLVLH
jgi:hypothetical protein